MPTSPCPCFHPKKLIRLLWLSGLCFLLANVETASAQTFKIIKIHCQLSREDTAAIYKIARYEASFYNAVFDTQKNDSVAINIHVFGRKADFKQTPDGENSLHFFADGYYLEKTGEIFVLKTEHVNSALLHEISHAFLHLNLKNPPKWFDEGLAVYFGSLIVDNNQIFYTPVVGRIERVKEMIAGKQFVPDDFLRYNNQNWGLNHQSITDKYTIAYSIIYFMVKTNLNFIKHMADGLKNGQTANQVFTEIFGSAQGFNNRYTNFYQQQNFD